MVKQHKNTIFIGVTGQIGAGKSTAARILTSFGAVVIDADRIGRSVVDKNPELLKKLALKFGWEIITPKGRLRRKKLAALAFASRKAKRQLDTLVHPYLLRELRDQMKTNAHRYDVVVVDAALLPDWNLDREVDLVLVIHASEKVRFQRLVSRGITTTDAKARQRTQSPFREYRMRSDRLILNSGTIKSLKEKLAAFYANFVQNRLTNG